VNLSTQVVSAIENGAVVDSWSVSSGAGDFSTHPGSFSVGWKTASQNMGNRDLTKAPYYFQPDVKWVMYFNGDQALHGVYWHSNWGTPMSHGCVGMPEWRAQWLFDWTPQGVGVNVHY
jgi:lipoprotein-anchoring transpeptidase ErfK/SrfK